MVKARTSWDCGIAALAMAVNKPYLKVYDWFHTQMEGYKRPEGYGLSPEEMSQYLFMNGVVHHVVDLDSNEDLPKGVISLRQSHFDKWRDDHRACLIAVSTDGEDGHWLYFDGNEMFDPHPQDKYVNCDELINHYAILIGY